MDTKETVALVAVIYALLKSIEMLVKAVVDKKKEKSSPRPYMHKEDIFEQLTAMFRQMTEALKEIRSDVGSMKPTIMALDPNTNWPRTWTDSPQQKRTHDNVNRLVEVTEEIAKTTSETNEIVKKKAA